ncbi:hypothetical protein GYMLUDRAFT_560072 [Collybiopsis luxurians FD-317 M1]|uniref:Uncharacterized protein n=1 Tax=Collybiopsis luxurians FD-317 M1 TaxID=944289 RepID=A0A0D0C1E0_9AGAR|nr:hypothetical protein GYMLUDRAFT_560072 [Collybiopsis luxurians FD-317 M1]
MVTQYSCHRQACSFISFFISYCIYCFLPILCTLLLYSCFPCLLLLNTVLFLIFL